jgi:hypothetical protein
MGIIGIRAVRVKRGGGKNWKGVKKIPKAVKVKKARIRNLPYRSLSH